MTGTIVMTPTPKYWEGTIPDKCEVCGRMFTDQFFAVLTAVGVWKILCSVDFVIYGRGLGTGLGHAYNALTGMQLPDDTRYNRD
jgi:hypothetical protein